MYDGAERAAIIKTFYELIVAAFNHPHIPQLEAHVPAFSTDHAQFQVLLLVITSHDDHTIW